MKIRINSLITLLVCVLLINSPYLSQTVNNAIVLATECILLYWFFGTKNHIRTLKLNWPIIIFAITTIFCTCLNFGIATRTLNALVTGMKYVVIFIVVEKLVEKSTFQNVINTFFKILFSFSIIADLSIWLTLGKGIGGQKVLNYYIIGNKFQVAYLHMILLALFLIQDFFVPKDKLRKRVYWFYLIYTIFLCFFIECSTGLFGCLTMGAIAFFIKKKGVICKYLAKPSVFLIIFIGATFLLVGTNVLLESPFFSNLFLKLSHTNRLLSGRVEMYEIAMTAIKNNPIWGYGINCTIVEDILSWGNPQNGLLKMLLDYGILGTAVFFDVIIKVFRNANINVANHFNTYALMSFLYGMAICSMVEINISGYFFLGLAFLNCVKKRNVQEAKNEIQ